MYHNYIFDLYGTLIDIHTDEEKETLWNSMADCYKEKGALYTPKELRKSYLKLCKREEKLLMKSTKETYPEIQIDKVFSQLFSDQSIYVDEQMVSYIAVKFRELSRESMSLYPGVKEMLGALKKNGKKVYLLSNAQRLFTIPEIEEMGLEEYFDDIFLSSDYGIKKPEKAYMQLLLDKHHLEIRECIMIGNELKSDILVANACGMDSLYFHSTIDALPEKVSATYYMTDRTYWEFNSLYG